jgi:putative tricarboxylic transport membrane protein
MIATVGVDGIYGVERFTFGVPMLADGIEYLTVMVGAYGWAKCSCVWRPDLRRRRSKRAARSARSFPRSPRYGRSSHTCAKLGAWHHHGCDSRRGRDDRIVRFVRRRGAVLQTSQELGSGIAEGIVAPQTASTATVAGHMVPLLTLGIPGSGATAVILGAFLLHGVQPGRSFSRRIRRSSMRSSRRCSLVSSACA